MHEAALFADLRRELDTIARRERATRLQGVTLWVGALSHLTEAIVRERWPEVVRGSAAEGARLTVETSLDIHDPRARGVVLRSVAVAEGT